MDPCFQCRSNKVIWSQANREKARWKGRCAIYVIVIYLDRANNLSFFPRVSDKTLEKRKQSVHATKNHPRSDNEIAEEGEEGEETFSKQEKEQHP